MDLMLQPKYTDWQDGYKNKTHIYPAYKKPTSDLKTHIDWEWEDGKICSMSKKVAKGSCSNNPHVRQNRPQNKDYKR